MINEKFTVIARGVVKPSRREELMLLMRKVRDMDEARESGTIVQSFQFERDNPHVYWNYMLFANREAREIHHQHLAEINPPDVREYFEQWPHSTVCTPLCAKGIDLT